MDSIKLLIVDDDEAVLKFMGQYLSRLGYEVETMASGLAAWERFNANPLRYSLIVVDLTLEDLPGEELARRVLLRDDSVRVLVASGYPFQPASLNLGSAVWRVAALQKPFLPKMLSEAVDGLLSSAPPVP